ncbi:MAG: hypothetical protein P4L28_01685 [Paludibacteraceae bacterium]|nr:hypothetical protein [Paludibacteraceae bacterium]
MKKLSIIILLLLVVGNMNPANKQKEPANNRTTKKIIVAGKATAPYYAIQILALKEPPRDAGFFQNIESAREFSCKDGFKRYVVGKYNTEEEAATNLARIKALSPKYQRAYVVNTENYDIESSAFSNTPTTLAVNTKKEASKTNRKRTSKKIIPVDKLIAPYFSIQVLALKEAPQDANFFEHIDAAREVSCADGFKRYLVGQYETKEDAEAKLPDIRNIGLKYKNAFVINTQNMQIEASAFTRNYQEEEKIQEKASKPQQPVTKPVAPPVAVKTKLKKETPPPTSKIKEADTTQVNIDENNPIRTSKKIMPVDKASKPYYTVQILALKEAPKDPNFFDDIEICREFSCTDGYKRYTVGQYETAELAAKAIPRIKALSPKYEKAFVANTETYNIALSEFRSNYNTNTQPAKEETQTVKNTDSTDKVAESAALEPIDPNKTYTIQITASRYPFYTSELKGFTDVYEFFMPDKIYRYCEGKYKGSEIEAELKRIIKLGYNEAFYVEWDKYAPYKIE